MSESVRLDSFVNPDAEWQELLTYSSSNHIFFTPQWQKSWWQVFGGGYELTLLSINDGSRLVGIAPLKHKDNVLSFIGSSDVCDYMDFIVRAGYEDYFFTQLLGYLERLDWKSLEMDSVLPDSVTLRFLAPFLRQKGYRVEINQTNVSPQLFLPANWEDYFTLLKTKDRHEIRRKLRRLEQGNAVNYLTVTEPAQMPSALESFFSLFQLSNPEKANFMTAQKREFFTVMVSSLAEKGNIRLSFLEVDGVRSAATLCFDYNKDIYLYNSAYNPAYSPLSVSLLLEVYDIQDAIKNGKKRFDFLSGNEPYKYDLGGHDVPLSRCVISRS
jgi:CelD/BcsL family acetyltransferase involved in cellulose biosynthesis